MNADAIASLTMGQNGHAARFRAQGNQYGAIMSRMMSKQAGNGRSSSCHRATLILTCLALSGCSGTNATSSLDGGASNAAGGGGAGRTLGGAGMGGNLASTGGAGGTGGSTPATQTCTNPSHVLPLNPSNPQDGITLSGFYVDTDTWNAANYPVSQTMYICDYNNWYVVANMNNNTGDGAVKTYPNVHMDFNSAPEISSFSNISSSFAHTAPHVGIYEFAYDIWLNGVASSGSTEVMIWTDNYNQVPSGSQLETVTFDGQTYQVYKSGSYIAFVETTNVTSGTVNLLSFFNHVIGKGWIPSTSTVGAIDYGIELVFNRRRGRHVRGQ